MLKYTRYMKSRDPFLFIKSHLTREEARQELRKEIKREIENRIKEELSKLQSQI